MSNVPTADGVMPVFITHPREGGPFPAVVVYMDFWGVREEIFDLARRIAVAGYYCAVPDLYYRQGTIRTERRDAQGRMLSWHLLDEADRELVLEPLRKLSDSMAMKDTEALLRFLDTSEPVRRAPMGCIGWCLGGRLVVRAGARFPQRFTAMASLHPTTMVTGEADSAHRSLSALRGEIYFGLAELDRHSQPDTIAALRASLEWAPVRSHIEVHRGIDHGYALPDRDIFDKQAANRDWEHIFSMFRRRLQLA